MAVSTKLKPGKQTVELAPDTPRPSRIRREPPPPAPKAVIRYPTERETMTVVVGVILFALALMIITLGVSNYTKTL